MFLFHSMKFKKLSLLLNIIHNKTNNEILNIIEHSQINKTKIMIDLKNKEHNQQFKRKYFLKFSCQKNK